MRTFEPLRLPRSVRSHRRRRRLPGLQPLGLLQASKLLNFQASKQKKGPSGLLGPLGEKSRRRATLPRANPAVPSPMRPFTSVFGMGTGVSSSLWPPGKQSNVSEMRRAPRGASQSGAKCVTASLWAISIGWLSALLRLHRRPIKVVVFHPPSLPCGRGDLVFGEAWRLDAFSAYPFRT